MDDAVQSELLGDDRLAEYAGELARRGEVSTSATGRFDVAAQLREIARSIRQACHVIETAVSEERAITPAARWLIENLHVVEEQLTDLPDALTAQLLRRLPQLDPSQGIRAEPRICSIARGYANHSDGHFEIARLSVFISAYQQQRTLQMRELWALPAILRLTLLLNLGRIAERTASALQARARADKTADRALSTAAATSATFAGAGVANGPDLASGPYLLQLVERLRYAGSDAMPALSALKAALDADGLRADELVQREHARQSANNVTARNVITSFRDVAAADWREFFEANSLVEATLRVDAGYVRADHQTRDRYRDAIEELATRCGRPEAEVAHEAHLASRCSNRDIGFCLIDAGRCSFEVRLGVRPSLQQRILRATLPRAATAYLTLLAMLTGGIAAGATALAYREAEAQPAEFALVVFALFALVSASELALSLVNRALMWLLPARRIPRLSMQSGIPADCATLVVVPVLLTSEEQVRDAVQQLEVHSAANRDPAIRFALLTDWPDSDSERRAGDAELLDAARAGVAHLNQQRGAACALEPAFYVLHRRRQWSVGEQCWMGWERKRGKLAELNSLLLRGETGSFVGDPDRADAISYPARIRYVVTLDADTRLPFGAVAQLVGAAAHPLNAPQFDSSGRRVVAGYGIIQPRVVPLLPRRGEQSVYRDIVSGSSGMDPYAGAVSDVYQDVFRAGIFTGKGLYDLAAFDQVMRGRIPPDTVLSHDLLESLYARAALASDIECYEEFPSHSEVAAARLHRWKRGDWQLLRWLFGVAGSNLSALDKWKILDNLRRSLIAPAAILLLTVVWVSGGLSWVALGLIAAPTLLPRALGSATHLLHALRTAAPWRWLRVETLAWFKDLRNAFAMLALLAQNAWLMADAIGRALIRQFITHRHRLQWVTAAQVKSMAGHGVANFVWSMRGASIVVVAVAGVIMAIRPIGLRAAAPLLLLWWLSPLIARAFSRSSDLAPRTRAPRDPACVPLRLIARRTWRFFTTLVTAEENHLPPDNLQESPQPVIAHRTSPTNISLYLLSTASAHDFGWIGLRDTLDRLSATLGSIDQLEQHRGHLFNWYDTRRAAPLEPRYVSTVDSGNLCGHLLALRQWCYDARRRMAIRVGSLDGLCDTLDLVRDSLLRLSDQHRVATVSAAEIEAAVTLCAAQLAQPPTDARGAAQMLREIGSSASRLADLAAALAADAGSADTEELLSWATCFRDDAASLRRDAQTFAIPIPAGLPEPWRLRVETAAAAAGARRLEDLPGCTAALRQQAYAWQRELNAGDASSDEALAALQQFTFELARVGAAASQVIAQLDAVAQCAARRVEATDFTFLFDAQRKLFSIGWRHSDSLLDPSFYDLLASEARLASFVAIAKADVTFRHWRHLGRRLTGSASRPLLVSWSGSMFEYLMPALVMHEPAQGLLDLTARRAIQSHIEYASTKDVPWGISESAYNVRDAELTYQYSAFGVPGIALRRGLERNIVVAPYATALACMYFPQRAIENFRRLEELGALGRYGFYESLDFTRERRPDGARPAVVRAWMAHHQGMSIVGIANGLALLTGQGGMRRHFHANATVQAAELLLEEQAPGPSAQPRRISDQRIPARVVEEAPELERRVTDVATPSPIVHLLSNRRYAVMATAAGGGYSVCNGMAVTRWREDGTRDALGSFLYLKDVDRGSVWSATFQPTGVPAEFYEARFAEERASWLRRDGGVQSLLEVVVSPEDDAELRRLTLHNEGPDQRNVEVTSYCEVVLAPLAADVAHRAFSNLFVQTEWIAELRGTLLAHRRPRSHNDASVWGGHVLAADGDVLDSLQYETDRARFLGRNSDLSAPISVVDGRPLSNTAGIVLDPVFSLRVRVALEPGETRVITFSTFVCPTREAALRLADKLRQRDQFERVAMQAWTYARAGLHHLGVDVQEARLFQELAGHVVHADYRLRSERDLLAANDSSAAALWRFGISGDRPILLVRCSDPEHVEAARQMLRAQEYWRSKQLIVDVVLLNERAHSYQQDLQQALEETARTAAAWTEGVAGVGRPIARVLQASTLTPSELTLLLAAPRAVIVPRQGSLAEQLERPNVTASVDSGVRGPAVDRGQHAPLPIEATDDAGAPALELEFYNGFGGFADDGREYVMELRGERRPPLPWSNVLANPQFGTLLTEAGSAFTWAQNSRENMLTPWSNDAVSDPSGEALYLRDEESGRLWSPCAQPIRLPSARYRVAHGRGYSRFSVDVGGIAAEMTIWVDCNEPIKWCALRVTNHSGRRRRLSLTTWVEWVLGTGRAQHAPFVVTEQVAGGAMLARNAWNADFAGRVAWLDLGGRATQWTGSRREFLGRHGSPTAPAALAQTPALSCRTGAGFDPCAALTTFFELADGATDWFTVTLGQGSDRNDALRLIQSSRARSPTAALREVQAAWQERLGALRIRTPDRGLDILVNHWLLYQVISCRLWARAAFYQAGGAFGFRDQLQDTLALLHTQPELAREQNERAARRQFVEGDVQHWWHPPSGRGVRTRFADDRLWLPYVAAHYLAATADSALLDIVLPFLDGSAVEPGREDAHFEPRTSDQCASVYEHCARAIDISLGAGPHGLPLMGGGDWNDGMNRVGIEGRGESVWMAWFLISTIDAFAPQAERRGDRKRAAAWRAAADGFRAAAESAGWDGAWYRRAYFDDGTALGSASNSECRIDAIAQSWAVLSGAGDHEHARIAMDSVREYLVKDAEALVLLFTPPFDRSPLEPGYIKGYLPGVRENGAQYTHAAVWTLMAFALQGRTVDVAELIEALNPIHRSATRRGSGAYKVEPYVLAADVYSQAPHATRGGWTWYTGAAAWMHRAALEAVIGVRIFHDRITFAPCLPEGWRDCEFEFRSGVNHYRVNIQNGGSGREIASLTLDGVPISGNEIPRAGERSQHVVHLRLR